MGMEYRGSRVSEDQDIIRLLDARNKAAQVTQAGDAQSIIDSRVSPLAGKGYVDSAFDNYATQADVNAAYADKVPYSEIGNTVLGLDANGKIPPDKLPSLTTRGAKWISGGGITPRLDVGDGGIFQTTPILSSVYVNASLMGGRPFYILGFAQIEVKGNFAASQPIVYINSNSGFASNYSAVGYGIPGWMDYYHLTVLPTSDNLQIHSSSKTMYLTCRSPYASSDFGNYYPSWGLLLVPVLDY